MKANLKKLVTIFIIIGILFFYNSAYSNQRRPEYDKKHFIDLFKLISLFLIPASASYNVQSWFTGADPTSPIEWKTSGIEWNENRKAFIREGEVIITISGKPLYTLQKYVEPSPWKITLIGAHAGISQLDISPQTSWNLDLELELRKNAAFNLYKCDPEQMASMGQRIYEINVPDKKTAWLYYEWSCGSGGCGGNLRIFLFKKDADKIPELTTKCP